MDAAEPPSSLADQFLLLVTDPRHVAVRPQQHRGHLQLLADADDVVDPLRPAHHPKPAGLVEQQPAAAVQQLIQATPPSPTSRSRRPSRSCPHAQPAHRRWHQRLEHNRGLRQLRKRGLIVGDEPPFRLAPHVRYSLDPGSDFVALLVVGLLAVQAGLLGLGDGSLRSARKAKRRATSTP
jgi:hypothetical protein